MSSELLFLGGFLALVVAMLAVDLGVAGRRSHVIGVREALVWTGVWVAAAGLFYVFLLFRAELLHGVSLTGEALQAYRSELSLEFLTGYLIEKALSVDNIFVMIMILMSFGVEEKYYHKILFWGVFGAIVMRFGFIFLASALVARFAWVLWVFGAFLLFTGVRMLFSRERGGTDGTDGTGGSNGSNGSNGSGGSGCEKKIDTGRHPVVRLVRRFFRLTRRDYGGRFAVRLRGRLYVTPLLVVLVMIECSDVIFAVDSIPAIFAVTTDPYIVFFSNIFAILGLRSLFFVLAGVMGRFRFLKTGLAVLLAFIGAKMLLHGVLHISISTTASLMAIVGILAASVAASLIFPVRDDRKIRE